MKKKINLVELLKDCPNGMKLNCTSYDNVSFDKISDDKKAIYPIFCYITDEKGNRSGISFTENGCESKRYGAKCVIFPKGKTTWEGFQRPFKDGDIVTYKYENGLVSMILKKFVNFVEIHHHCALYDNAKGFVTNNYIVGEPKYTHLATEEEKQKLFNAIKENGYKWNAETKTLEKLVIPTFNNGDIVSTINGRWLGIVKKHIGGIIYETYITVVDGAVTDGTSAYTNNICGFERFATRYEKEKLFQAIKDNGYKWNDKTKTLKKLIEPKFKVGDKVRVKNGASKLHIIKDVCDTFYILVSTGKIDFTDQDNWELVPDKFNITTLKPFDKVLVRDNDKQKWTVDYFSFADKEQVYPFVCVGHYVRQCIPYEENEHLLGTTDDCDEYYKTW